MSAGEVISVRGVRPIESPTEVVASTALVAPVQVLKTERPTPKRPPKLRSIGPKVIKRYQNRKLYDTRYSCYVTLNEVAKMIGAGEDVVIIDNRSKRDITARTLMQIIFDAEFRKAQHAPLATLRKIIRNGEGTLSHYLEKIGVAQRNLKPRVVLKGMNVNTRSTRAPLTLEERIVAAATPHSISSSCSTPSLPHSRQAGAK